MIQLQEFLLLLDDTCLEKILQHITMWEDQVYIAKLSTKFKKSFHAIWKREAKYRSMNAFFSKEKNDKDLIFYLDTLKDDIDMMKFRHRSLASIVSKFKLHQELSFPNCHTFEIYGAPSPNAEIAPADIFRLHKAMPNLRKLRLNGYTQGKFLNKFERLEECHLLVDKFDYSRGCKLMNTYANEVLTLQNLHYLDIRPYRFKTLSNVALSKATKLRTLKLHFDTLMDMVLDVLSLANLKTLSVYLDSFFTHHNSPKAMHTILQIKAKQLVGLSIDNDRVQFENSWDNDLHFLDYKKLRKFAFNHWLGDPKMVEKYTKMTELRVLQLRSWPQLNNRILMQFIRACKHLQQLDITDCPKVTEELLYLILFELNKQHRTEVLWVYPYGSGMAKALLANKDFWSQQKLMKFTNTVFSSDCYSRMYRGMELNFE